MCRLKKALKIPSSTFNRLRLESDEEHQHRDSKVRKGSIKTPLDLGKKKYIERLVQPLTVPFTVKDI